MKYGNTDISAHKAGALVDMVSREIDRLSRDKDPRAKALYAELSVESDDLFDRYTTALDIPRVSGSAQSIQHTERYDALVEHIEAMLSENEQRAKQDVYLKPIEDRIKDLRRAADKIDAEVPMSILRRYTMLKHGF